MKYLFAILFCTVFMLNAQAQDEAAGPKPKCPNLSGLYTYNLDVPGRGIYNFYLLIDQKECKSISFQTTEKNPSGVQTVHPRKNYKINGKYTRVFASDPLIAFKFKKDELRVRVKDVPPNNCDQVAFKKKDTNGNLVTRQHFVCPDGTSTAWATLMTQKL